VAIDILQSNKVATDIDAKRKYTQDERTQYNSLLDLTGNIIGNMERMANGWTTKTKNTAMMIFHIFKNMIS